MHTYICRRGCPVCGSPVGNLQKAQELRIVLMVGQIGGGWVLRVLEFQESRIFIVFLFCYMFSFAFSLFFHEIQAGWVPSEVPCQESRNPEIQDWS